MDRDERLGLLTQLTQLQHREAENVVPLQTFLPLPSHRIALRPDIVVVRGGRGAGKTHLFRALQETDLARRKELFETNEVEASSWVDGFSQTGLAHPEVTALDEFARRADLVDLRLFWIVHLVRVLRDQDLLKEKGLDKLVEDLLKVDRAQVEVWIPQARQLAGSLTATLDSLERRLESEDQRIFVGYDHLDRIGSFNSEVRAGYVGSLLALWLSFSNRYRRIRGKIFLREDVFEQGQRRFPDATKLIPRSVSLEWTREDLYRVVVRHMAALSEPMRELLREAEGLNFQEHDSLGFMPGPMPNDVQKAFVQRLAGDLMGKGVRKGYTYRWIPNHLQDARTAIVPRSILVLIGHAAEVAQRRPLNQGSRLLEPRDLKVALVRTSEERVREIQEEYGAVVRLKNLRGHFVMIPRKQALELLGKKVDGEPKGLPEEGERIFEELLGLGVLKIRADGRVDVPDIYRYGYGIKRKGGVALPK